jgi:hypothetical protein
MKIYYSKFLFFILFGFLLAGCMHLNPKFRTELTFKGLKQYASDSTIVVFVIHGIGHQEQNYSYKLINGLGKNVLGKGFTYESKSPENLQKGNLEKFTLKNNHQRLIVYSITWSSFSDPYKDALRKEEFGRRPYNWNISEKVKDVIMIDRAGDLFFAQHSEILPKILETVDIAFADMERVNPSEKINIISGSLGSQVFLKYLSLRYAGFLKNNVPFQTFCSQNLNKDLKKDSLDKNSDLDFLAKEEKELYLKVFENQNPYNEELFNAPLNASFTFDNSNPVVFTKALNFYMLTNQYNLMSDNFKVWGGLKLNIENIDLRPKFEEVKVVAFKNPNDMLCYQLPENFLAANASNSTKPEVVNVWYWNLIFRNNIIQAHTAPFHMRKFYKVISYGSTNENGCFTYSWVKLKDKQKNKK